MYCSCSPKNNIFFLLMDFNSPTDRCARRRKNRSCILADDMKKYMPESNEMTVEAIKKFVQDYKDGNLKVRVQIQDSACHGHNHVGHILRHICIDCCDMVYDVMAASPFCSKMPYGAMPRYLCRKCNS